VSICVLVSRAEPASKSRRSAGWRPTLGSVSTPILVLVGAGASFASGDVGTDERPPLTRQLFSCARAQRLLTIYTLAREADSVITRDMRSNTTIAFEEALRRLETDGYPHHQQMALAVPPFLQALMLEYSQILDSRCFRYGILVDELLKLRSTVVFVSLNYDTLLDNRLAAFSPLNSMRDYIETPLGWSLIKPHGSVAWFFEQSSAFDPRTPPGDRPITRKAIECVPTTAFDLVGIRASDHREPHGLSVRYPALALPDGQKDELVLPPEHLDHLRGILGRSREIYLLLLGYSALDTEVLKLITESDCKVRRMSVVNYDATAALEVFDRVTSSGIEPIWPDVFDGSYTQWIDKDGLSRWAAEYMGRPESANDPTELRQALAERAYQQDVQRRLQ
jgi:hypothetical protein